MPNGFHATSIVQAINAKRSGLTKGVPDLVVPVPINGFHGLFLELKRANGGIITIEQQEWLDFLNSVGYLAKVARGAKEAIQIVEQYFNLDYTVV